MSAPTEYETMMIDKYLKESVISQAQAIWSKEHSLGQQWSTVVATPTAGSYRAHVIVYQGHDGRDGHKRLASSTMSYPSSKAALQNLLEQLQHRLSAQIGDEGYRATSPTCAPAQVDDMGYSAKSPTYAPTQVDDMEYSAKSPTYGSPAYGGYSARSPTYGSPAYGGYSR